MNDYNNKSVSGMLKQPMPTYGNKINPDKRQYQLL